MVGLGPGPCPDAIYRYISMLAVVGELLCVMGILMQPASQPASNKKQQQGTTTTTTISQVGFYSRITAVVKERTSLDWV